MDSLLAVDIRACFLDDAQGGLSFFELVSDILMVELANNIVSGPSYSFHSMSCLSFLSFMSSYLSICISHLLLHKILL